MNDLISRQAAIDAIEEDKIDLDDPIVVGVFKATGDFEKAETQVMTCDRHIKILKDLPSAQPEPHWIPCSERLPEYSGTYLVTLVDEDGQTWGDTCEWGSTFGGRWLAVFDSEYRDVSNVVAWMPLPEPYKGGE